MAMIVYRIALEDEVPEAEALMREEFGDDAVQPRDMADVIVGVRDGKVIAAAYIMGLVRVDSLVVDKEARGTGVSLSAMNQVAESHLRYQMREHGINKLVYYTFLHNFSKVGRMLELGYHQRPWKVFEKVLTLKENK